MSTHWLNPVTGASATNPDDGTTLARRVSCPGLLSTVVTDQDGIWWVFGGVADATLKFLRQRQSPRNGAPRTAWLSFAYSIRQRQTYR